MIRFQFEFNLRTISSFPFIKTLESTDRNHFSVVSEAISVFKKRSDFRMMEEKRAFQKIIKLDRQRKPMKPVNFINYLFILRFLIRPFTTAVLWVRKAKKHYYINGKKVLRINDIRIYKGDYEGTREK